MTDHQPTQEQQTGYIKVNLNYAPKTNGKKFAKWCEESGFTPLNGGRRAWSSSLSTYLRGASGVAYADGEPFLFYEEDLVDITALIQEANKKSYTYGYVAGYDDGKGSLKDGIEKVKRLTSNSGGSNNGKA